MAHILLVDDDAAVRRATETLLRVCGHTITSLSSGLKIEAEIAAQRPDLVILDILMPGRDGLEIVIALRERFPGLPVLVVSGGGEKGNLNFLTMAKSLGAAAAMSKPIDGEALIDLVAALTAGAPTATGRSAGGRPR